MRKQNWLIIVFAAIGINIVCSTMVLALDNYVRVYAKDAFISGSPADHTYVTIWGKGYAVANSSTSGGWYVTRSLASTQNINRSIKASACALTYLKNGVCHQHSNRMMFYAGSVIPSYIRYYNISKALFGVYGDTGPVSGRFSTCKASIK